MGKNKLARWAELRTFNNVIESTQDLAGMPDHPIKGKWKSDHFRNSYPVVLELGCGKGEYTLALARKFREKNFIGVDIKGARIWKGAREAFEEKLDNVMFIRTRIEFIKRYFENQEVDEIWITFPDPFPRPRDENRRLVSPFFLNLYGSILAGNGLIHLKTDNSQLAEYLIRVVTANGMKLITSSSDFYGSPGESDILPVRSHYENIFLKEGKKINYVCFSLRKNQETNNEII